MRAALAACAVLLAACAKPPAPSAPPAASTLTPATRFAWAPVGPGGGGTIIAPVAAPHDPNLLFCACDMGGAYRSDDGGATWTMLPWEQIRYVRSKRQGSWGFSWVDRNVLYVGAATGFLRSDDAGRSWRPVRGPLGRAAPELVAFSSGQPRNVAAVFGRPTGDPRSDVWLSADHGGVWKPAPPLPAGAGAPLGLLWDIRRPSRLVVGCERGVFALESSWRRLAAGLEADELIDFAGASDGRRTILYATTPTRDAGGTLAGGVWVSRDGGSTWLRAMAGLPTAIGRQDRWSRGVPRYEHLACADPDPATAYVTSLGTVVLGRECSGVYRTTDAGVHWSPVLYGDPRMRECNVETDWLTRELGWGWGEEAFALAVSDANRYQVLRSDHGRLQMTRDGGRTWRSLHAPPERHGAVPNGGLGTTTTWHYVIDPHDPTQRFLCATDIGFFRSEDSGETWRRAVDGSPYDNTFYCLVADPEPPGRLWAGVSNTHDIPYWGFVTRDATRYKGAVVRSDDGGRSWRPVGGDSLPSGAVTDLQRDADGTLWAAVLGRGLFRGSADGERWEQRGAGLGLEHNPNVLRVRRAGRRLLALVTMKYDEARRDLRAGGIFASDDEGLTWRRLNRDAPLWHPVELAIDPRDERVLYVACMEAPLGRAGGGLWKSADGGASWRRVHRAGDGPSFAPALCPSNPDLVYHATFGDGLWVSGDAGGTWHRVEGFPFANVHRVTFDPTRGDRVYVTTFGGGTWQGTAQP